MTADFTHLEFMMSAKEHSLPIISHMQVNHAQGLYAMWKELSYYLKPLLKKFQAVSESYTSLIEDDSDMLTQMANMKIESDLMKEYIAKKMNPFTRKKMKIWMDQENKKIEAKIAKIADEEVFRKVEEGKIRAKAKAKFGKKVEKCAKCNGPYGKCSCD